VDTAGAGDGQEISGTSMTLDSNFNVQSYQPPASGFDFMRQGDLLTQSPMEQLLGPTGPTTAPTSLMPLAAASSKEKQDQHTQTAQADQLLDSFK